MEKQVMCKYEKYGDIPEGWISYRSYIDDEWLSFEGLCRANCMYFPKMRPVLQEYWRMIKKKGIYDIVKKEWEELAKYDRGDDGRLRLYLNKDGRLRAMEYFMNYKLRHRRERVIFF